MKKVLVLFGKSDWQHSEPFQKKPQYRFCYEFFYSLAAEQGIEIYRASYQWYDAEKNVFLHAWKFENGVWGRTGEVMPDLIFDKCKHTQKTYEFKVMLQERFPIINEPEFTKLLNDKIDTSLLFPDFSKKCFLLSTGEDVQRALSEIQTERVVIKPQSGSGGDGVCIIPKNQVTQEFVGKNMFAQEFIDGSKGIAGITDGLHDLRLVFVNDVLVYSYIRIPAQGSLLANLAQGGSMHIVQPAHLPQSLEPLIARVKEELARFPQKIFTVDLMFDEKQKPWIVEFNTMPGMYFAPGQEKTMRTLYQALIDLFKTY